MIVINLVEYRKVDIIIEKYFCFESLKLIKYSELKKKYFNKCVLLFYLIFINILKKVEKFDVIG